MDRPAFTEQPIHLLFESNAVPSDSHTSLLKDMIRNGQSQISELDAQIAALTSRREDISQRVDVLQGVVSPLRRIPPEIISEIFLFYLAYDHEDHENDDDDDHDDWIPPPLLLGQVCSFWRKVTLETPRLWTTLAFTFDAKYHRDIGVLKKWAELAKGLPLSMFYEIPTSLSSRGIISDALLPYVHQVERLSLQAPAIALMPLHSINGMPLLKSLTLHIIIRDKEGDLREEVQWEGSPINLEENTPYLDTLFIQTDYPVSLIHDQIVLMPWAQLKELSLEEDCITPTEARGIFCLSLNLVKCTMLITAWEDEDEPDDLPICVHPNLTSLSLTFDGAGKTFPFFQPLTLPNLLTLELTHKDTTVLDPLPTFCELHSRAPFPLTTLLLAGVSSDSASHTEFLSLVPTLVTFTRAGFTELDNSFMSTMTISTSGAGCLFPNLETLHLDGWEGLDEDEYLTMIESRCSEVSHLKSATLEQEGLDWYDPVRMKRVAVLREGGLELTLEGYE